MTSYKRKSRSKYYGKYQAVKQKGMLTLYPSPYDSMLLYFNELVIFSDAAVTGGAFYGARRPQRFTSFTALRPYYGQWRTEKVTVRISFSEVASQSACYMATTHSEDGLYTTAPTVVTMKNYRDYQIYQVNQNCPKKVWYMNPNDAEETSYLDVPSAVITDISEAKVGGILFFVSQIVGAGNTSISVHIQYKVRFIGKQAVGI